MMHSQCPYIYIFIDVFAAFDTAANFNIDVAVISHQECWIIWYNPSVIQPLLTYKYLVTIIPSSIYRVYILSLLCALTEVPRVLEPACTVLHASTLCIKNSTGTMHHVFANKLVEKRIFFSSGSSAEIYLSKSSGLLNFELLSIISKKCSCGKPLF